jgi:RHS repeat-associated protein
MENYDVFGHATRVVDANGVATETTYDALGRLRTSTLKGVAGCDTAADPLCGTDLTSTNTFVPPSGPLTTSVRPSGVLSVYSYDNRGRVASLARGATAVSLSERIEYDYNPANDLKSQERYVDVAAGNAVRRRESYSYDASNRLALLTHDDTTTVGYSYDGSGHLITVKDERHVSPNTTNSYDAAGRLLKVTQVLSAAVGGTISTQYGYDINDNLTSVTDPNGNITTYLYDDFGRMLKQVSPVTGTSTYAYDAAGNIASSIDANGATTVRTYDAANRALTAVSTCQTSENTDPSETVSWTYDDSMAGRFGIGRLAAMTDPSGSTNYAYDRRGSLRSEDRLIGTWSSSTAYQYDADGNRTKLGDLEYAYDHAGRPLAVSRRTCSGCTPTPLISSASYLPFGPETDLFFGNGTRQTKTYDTRYRITENRLTGPGALTLADFAYVTDAGGNITTIQDSVDAAYNRTFGYDDINRLITANTGSSLWSIGTYSYDRMGNMLSSQIGDRTEAFTYTGTTPLIAAQTEQGTAFGMTYDASGNELFAHYVAPPAHGGDGDGDGESGGGPIPPSNGIYVSRTYSCRNLMAAEFTSNQYRCSHPPCHPGLPGNIYLYTYDGRGVRVRVTANGGGQENEYVYTPELQLLQRRNAISAAVDEFVWFNGHAVAQLSSQTSTPVFTFTDHLGTPVAQTDAAANLVWFADYEPYGRIYQTRLSNVDQPLRLPGQDVAFPGGVDENYNIFRWYRSAWGRYTQADPIRSIESPFAYADDRPLMLIDPTGLSTVNFGPVQKHAVGIGDAHRECASAAFGLKGCARLTGFRFDCKCQCAGGAFTRSISVTSAAIDVFAATNAPTDEFIQKGLVPVEDIFTEEMKHVRDFQAFAASIKDSLDYLEETPYTSSRQCKAGCRAAQDWFIALIRHHIAVVDASHPPGYYAP